MFVGPVTRRSLVRIQPPLPMTKLEGDLVDAPESARAECSYGFGSRLYRPNLTFSKCALLLSGLFGVCFGKKQLYVRCAKPGHAALTSEARKGSRNCFLAMARSISATSLEVLFALSPKFYLEFSKPKRAPATAIYLAVSSGPYEGHLPPPYFYRLKAASYVGA